MRVSSSGGGRTMSVEILSDRLEWRPDLKLAPLVIDLPAYFREVWREIPPP